MEKLDIKDRKILYHLDLDSRQSFSQIGKKVGLHKDAVANRVKKLQKNGVIRRFLPVINSSVLGYSWYRFYFTFQYTSPEIENEIIDYFVNEKYAHAVGRLEGQYDLLVNAPIWIKSIFRFIVAPNFLIIQLIGFYPPRMLDVRSYTQIGAILVNDQRKIYPAPQPDDGDDHCCSIRF